MGKFWMKWGRIQESETLYDTLVMELKRKKNWKVDSKEDNGCNEKLWKIKSKEVDSTKR